MQQLDVPAAQLETESFPLEGLPKLNKIVNAVFCFCLHSVVGSFLQVIPLDSRGEALLAALHTSVCSPRSQQRESLIDFEEDDSPASLHSSTEDLGKKVLIIMLILKIVF